MSGRPRGRPRKDGQPVRVTVKPPKEEVEGQEEEEEEEAAGSSVRRSSPRKRRATNFDGFVVETPGLGVVGEGADIIKEIEEEEPIIVKDEDDVDDTYKPGPTPNYVKRRSKVAVKRKTSEEGADGDAEMVRMDDIDEDLDDPMRRVERRGRKKRRDDELPTAPIKKTVKKVAVKSEKKVGETSKAEGNAAEPAEQSIASSKTGERDEGREDGEAPPTLNDPPASASSPSRKSPRGSPTKTAAAPPPPPPLLTPSKVTGTARRKQAVTADEDEIEEEEFGVREEVIEEEVPEELVEEDLVDVESFEVSTLPMRAGGGGMGGGAGGASHMLARMQNKPFRCGECGASYRREAYLLNHLAHVHQDECAILSAAERSAKKAERRPERMLPKERPGEAAYKFGCDLCERRFLRWEGLIVHQKQIHKEVTAGAKEQEKNRDYGAKCPVCLLYFFGNHALSEHVSKNHPDHNRFIFACDICGMGFMHWARVRAHKTQFHNCPVKYTQGYLKKNPEMARIVEAQRMKKAVERNRAKRMLEKGLLTGLGRDYSGLSRNEMSEYMYLMPPTLEPEVEGEMFDDVEEEEDDEEIVEEEGIIDANEMMNIQMVPLPPSSVRRVPLPPRMMSYRDHFRPTFTNRSHHQLSAIHQRVTHLNRQDLEILNRRMPEEVDSELKMEDDLNQVDVETGEEELMEEEVVDGELDEEEAAAVARNEEMEGEDVELPPELDMYA